MSPSVRLLVALVIAAGVIGGIIWLGQAAREDLALVVEQLDVPSPPGMKRATFLAEVRYQDQLPEKLSRADASTAQRLQSAFSKHPWVESVQIGPLTEAQPVIVRLRTPAMIVAGRVLDRNGVVLPMRTSTAGLPEYLGAATSQQSESGKPFADQAVVEAAQRVGWLQVNVPNIKWKSVEMTPDGLVLTRADGAKVIWGKGASNEPTIEQKLAKLKTWSGGDLDLRKY
jgi:hypothetical protein